MKVGEGGRVVLAHVLVATGVNADERREVHRVKVTSAEDGAAGWPSSATSVSAASPGCTWSFPMPTPAWPRLLRCLLAFGSSSH
jgi:Transposase, Mutator family